MEDREQVTGSRGQQADGGAGGVASEVGAPAVTVEGAVDNERAVREDDGGDDLAGVRELVLAAHPDIVPELLAGDSLDALLASVPAARAAYERVAATVRAQSPAPAAVPTGNGRRRGIDPEALSPEGKIQEGIREQRL